VVPSRHDVYVLDKQLNIVTLPKIMHEDQSRDQRRSWPGGSRGPDPRSCPVGSTWNAKIRWDFFVEGVGVGGGMQLLMTNLPGPLLNLQTRLRRWSRLQSVEYNRLAAICLKVTISVNKNKSLTPGALAQGVSLKTKSSALFPSLWVKKSSVWSLNHARLDRWF